jgi:hypothetical protein
VVIADAAGIVIAIILLWVAAQFFGGRFSHFPYSGQQGCITVVIAMLLMLAVYLFGIAP